MRALLAVAAAVALSGCAIGPTYLRTANGSVPVAEDAGPRPSREVIDQYLRASLRDPSSAQVERVVGPGFVNQKSHIITPAFYGWVTCFDVNAKNAFGGYTGFKRNALVVRDGRIVYTQTQDDSWRTSVDWFNQVCGAAAG